MEDWEDYEVDDLTKRANRKKGVNGNRKGKRGERGLAEIFTKRFGETFSRTIGSGNRWSQVNLSETAQNIFSGDLVTPDNFMFVLECKSGYNKITLDGVFEGGNSDIDDFLDQVTKDSKRTKKKPMLLWKRDRKPWLAFLKTEDLIGEYEYSLKYRAWTAVPLKKVLELPDEFFFKQKNHS